MPAVRITLNVEVDGEPLKGFPIVRRFEPTDKMAFDFTKASGVGFAVIAGLTELAAVQAFLFQPGQNMSIKLAGDGTGVLVNRGGLVLILDASSGLAPTIENNSGSSGKVQGFAAGT